MKIQVFLNKFEEPIAASILTLTLCLVGKNLGRMENIRRKIEWKIVFSTVWQKRENRKEGILGRKFSLLGPQIFSSQIGRKSRKRKSASHHFYHNALIHDLLTYPTWWLLSTNPYHFFASAHLITFTAQSTPTCPGSLLSFLFFQRDPFFFFFFFQRDLLLFFYSSTWLANVV